MFSVIKKAVLLYAVNLALRSIWDGFSASNGDGLGFVDNSQRKVKDGSQYDYLFPKPKYTELVILENTTIHNTVKFMLKNAKKYAWQTANISRLLLGSTRLETLRRVFKFTFDHIAYRLDDDETEQVRTPARTWHDRRTGVDCDCFTVFIASILENLKIHYKMRVADYTGNGFQHIYIVVPDGNKEVFLDPVIREFNRQKPYLEKKDYVQ
ncbi:hypothetical protein ElyMa_005204200 [Elysia marginata]|uniref:Transglutaminase-like domain-containing protein n=1 Tax=Elysia marginata TaxID=1093978 RepID=A0AAV4JVX8_9GAST|nr:hypothetical protein ElyMa_005204200 [Elysia marginata]